jgi:hypothetical protein
VTTRTTTSTITTAATAALCLGLLTGCGGSDAAPQAVASPSSSPTSAPTAATPSTTVAPAPTTSAPKPKPKPTKTLAPLSRFEGEPVVKALRAFAAVSGRAVNANTLNYKPWLALMTPYGRKTRAYYIKEDLGMKYPGPLPFTPTAVKVTGSTATVKACVWVQGWGLNPRTGKPARARRIVPATFYVRKSGKAWLFDAMTIKASTCSGVSVKGRAF